MLGALLIACMVALVGFGIARLRVMRADYEARRPRKDDAEMAKQ